jgi:hypothetical protein
MPVEIIVGDASRQVKSQGLFTQPQKNSLGLSQKSFGRFQRQNTYYTTP